MIQHLSFKHNKYDIVTLKSEINHLTGDYMWWWSTDNSMSSGTRSDILGIVNNIRDKEIIINDTF